MTERWTSTKFANGSEIFHVNRTFVPDDPRLPVEKGAGTSFFAPDGTKTVTGKPTQLFYADGGIRLLDAGRVVFGDEITIRGHAMSLGADLAPPEATGEFLGIWRLIGDVGMVAGPMLVGLIAGSMGLDGSAITLMFAGFIASLTLAFLVKETRIAPMVDREGETFTSSSA